MRQFEPSQRLDRQLEAGDLTAEDMLELATELAGRHREAARVPGHEGLLAVTETLMWDNFRDLEGEVPGELLNELHRWTGQALRDRDAALRERCKGGFFRECHGDLHLANIVRLPQGIVAFDCIEFNAELRNIDVDADYAFLVMDLVARGQSGLAYVFLNRYLEITGDYDGVPLLPLYFVYRSLVRAKVAAISRRAREPAEDATGDRQTIDHYCELARAGIAARRPVLVLMMGLSASGKTWISNRLLAVLPALRMRSDIERKRLFGLAETDDSRSGVGSGIYDSTAGDAVYRRLFDGAGCMLRAGFDVILDAAFLAAARRDQGRRVAAACGAGCVIVEAVAPVDVLRKRLRERAATATDASEADLEVLQHQLDTVEPLDVDERASTFSVRTDAEVDIGAIVSFVRQATA
jgi:predicted kinase